MADKPKPKAVVLLMENDTVVDTAYIEPHLSAFFEYFRTKKRMGKKIPQQVEFRPDAAIYTVWLDGIFVAYSDVMPFNDVNQAGGILRRHFSTSRETANRIATIQTSLSNLVKSCTDEKGIPIAPTQEAVDQAKTQLIQYQTNNLSGE